MFTKRLGQRYLAVLAFLVVVATCARPRVAVSPVPSSSEHRSIVKSDDDEMPPAQAALNATLLQRCTAFPSRLVERPCAFPTDAGASSTIACVEFASIDHPDLSLLLVIVYRGRTQIAKSLGVPAIHEQLDAASPLYVSYKEFEGPRFSRVADGRVVTIEARSAGLGGVVKWATLSSPRRVFDLTLEVELPWHDYPVSKQDREALHSLDEAKVLGCLDTALWPARHSPNSPP